MTLAAPTADHALPTPTGARPPLSLGQRLGGPASLRETIASFLTSALLHALVIALLWLGQDTLARLAAGDIGVGTGIGPGLAGGGGGGADDEQINWIELPEEAPPPAPPEVPVPEIAPPPVRIESVSLAPALPDSALIAAGAAAADAGRGGGAGAGTGPGRGPGFGPGSGGGSGGGEGGGIGSGVGTGSGRGRLLAPSPARILLPPSAPASVRGKTVVVRLDVDSVGVVRGVQLIPATGDRKYDEKLRNTALGWKFRPARDASNRPVAVLFDVEFTF